MKYWPVKDRLSGHWIVMLHEPRGLDFDWVEVYLDPWIHQADAQKVCDQYNDQAGVHGEFYVEPVGLDKGSGSG